MLLNLLEKVCKEHIHNLEEPLANDLIELASTELTKDPVSCLVMWVCSKKLTRFCLHNSTV